MPSPFPGMDPYLESPDWFPALHDPMITVMIAELMRLLPEPYYARPRQRVWLEYTQRPIEPDGGVLRSSARKRARRDSGNGGVAVAAEVELADPVIVAVKTIEHDPYEEPFVEIHHRHGREDRLVSVIEILSPSNKTRGNTGREKYLEKQREVLASQVHLIEIDLLRGGTHATAVPRDLAIKKAGHFDYHICVHRFDRPQDFFVYPIQLEQRLPRIAVPLLPGDPDVPLALQTVFDGAYDGGPFHRVIFYGEDEIIPPLRAKQLKWVKAWLKTHP
jgi:hypothetical protein